MATTMDMNELKHAWRMLEQRLDRQHEISAELLRTDRLNRARGQLRPLTWRQSLQGALGIGLIVLGVSCWTANLHVPGLLLAGLLVHVMGLAHLIFAGLTVVLVARIDYGDPVLVIQKRLAQLLRLQGLNTLVCGWSWWVLWLPVVVAFIGLGGAPADAITPMWVWISLGVGVIGLLGTWRWQFHRLSQVEPDANRCDGSDGIRRSQQLLAEVAEFERE